jgi:periplasmic protein CpxP/Spy
MTRNPLRFALLLSALVLAPLPLRAQSLSQTLTETNAPSLSEPAPRKHPHLLEKLDLSASQKQQLDAIRDRYRPQLQTLKAERRQMWTELQAVLTPVQRQQLEQLRENRRDEWRAAQAYGTESIFKRHTKGHLIDKLNLTAEQRQQVQQIRDRHQPQMQALKDTRRQMWGEMRAALTPEQQQKLDLLRQQHRTQWQKSAS